MATIETTQTGDRVETHIRGRIFRFAPKPKQKQRSAAKEARRICVLSANAAARLTNWGISQPCYGPRCNHVHWTRDAVEDLVRQGQMRWIEGSGKNVAAWSQSRVWSPATSGGYTVLQMVVGG